MTILELLNLNVKTELLNEFDKNIISVLGYLTTEGNKKDDEIFKQKQKLNAIKRLAETLVHNDRTCSLEAQGFSQLECAEISTEDSIAFKLLGIIKGVGELKKDIEEDKEND